MNQLENWTNKNNITKIAAALAFALSDSRISKVVIGVDSLNQLKEIISNYKLTSAFPNSIEIQDERLLNPSEWGSI